MRPSSGRQQLIDLWAFNARYEIVGKPQLVAVHLHRSESHQLPMSEANTGTSLRNRPAFAMVMNRDRLHVYGEPTFHYFLNIERERSVRSDRPYVLLQVDLKDRSGAPTVIPQATSDRLFIALSESVRETDFLGWYEDQRVVGAVLTEVDGERQAERIRRAVDRVRRTVESHLPVEVSSCLDIRVSAVRDERPWS
jgi:hypothetical protein